ncbi:MAG TPA: hypothetical protein VGM82_20555 [Gemmatimonadaceae bacterium]|jgi:hypothetical protein
MRVFAYGVTAIFALCAASIAHAQIALPAYRLRILGVYTSDGDPIDGAEVSDALTKTTALTTKTGTITLSFLPEGGTLLRIRKVGFTQATMLVNIAPDDTLPVMVMLQPNAQQLAKVVTNDLAPRYVSPGLQAFEERRAQGNGYFVSEKELRKWDAGPITNVVRTIPGLEVVCGRGSGLVSETCYASSKRGQTHAFLGNHDCPSDIYLDGALYYSNIASTSGVQADRDLQKLQASQFAGVEYYSGGARIPPMYNKTGSACGVLLLWSRER